MIIVLLLLIFIRKGKNKIRTKKKKKKKKKKRFRMFLYVLQKNVSDDEIYDWRKILIIAMLLQLFIDETVFKAVSNNYKYHSKYLTTL